MLISTLIFLSIATFIITYVFIKVFVNPSSGRNFEKEMQMRFASDPAYAAYFAANPKAALEEALTKYKGRPFQFPPGVNVKVMEHNDNDIYVMFPRPPGEPAVSPLDRIVGFLDESRTYGLFMGSLEGIWWRMGLENGSCMSDIWAEVEAVKKNRPLKC